LEKALVAQDAGIGDDHVDAAPGVHRLLDEMGHARVIGDRSAVRDGRAARVGDFLHHRFRRCRVAAGAIHRAAQIVHDDLRAAFGEFQRMAAAQSAARARDDNDLVVIANGHANSPSNGLKFCRPD
jgi:hypothetical protein